MYIKLTCPKFKNTSAAPTAFLKEVIRFCKPSDCGPVRIWFKRGGHNGFSGMCYGGRYITCRVSDVRVLKRVHHSCSGNGYMDWNACTWEEAVVALVAHELRHIWQRRNPRGRRVWGSRGIASERDADAYAIRKMREWRAQKPARIVARIPSAALGRYRVLGCSKT